MATTETQTRIAAPCGCEFYGKNLRFCATQNCTAGFGEADRAAWMLLSGTVIGRHAQAAKKLARKAA